MAGSSPLLWRSSSSGRPAAPVLGVLNLDAICIEASGMVPGLGALATILLYKSLVEAGEEMGGGVDVIKETPVGVGGMLDEAV